MPSADEQAAWVKRQADAARANGDSLESRQKVGEVPQWVVDNATDEDRLRYLNEGAVKNVDKLSGRNALGAIGALGGSPYINAGAAQEAAFRDYMNAKAQNVYDAGGANQARGEQLAALQQMRANDGLSAAALQGRSAISQLNQQGVNAAGAGPLGARMAMAQLAAKGQGSAGAVGDARLQEYMAAKQAQMQAATGLRGADTQVAGDEAKSQLAAELVNNQRQVTGMQGLTDVEKARMEKALEMQKLYTRIRNADQEKNWGVSTNIARGGATLLGAISGAVK